MGAVFNAVRINAVQGDGKTDRTRAEVTSEFNKICEDDRYENGNSYSGTIGMAPGITFKNLKFDDLNAAYDYLETAAQKWENALAVRVGSQWVIGAWCSE